MFDSASFSSASFDSRSWGGLTEEQSQSDNIAGIYSAEDRNKRHKRDKEKRDQWRQRIAAAAGEGATKAAQQAINLAYPQIVTAESSVDIALVREQIAAVFPVIESQWSALIERLIFAEYEQRRLEDQEFAIVYALYEM